ncbi:MAG: RimK family protein [Planctomycetaceae bacterium]|nr:RimK family protein [Planctomycetaceae bacterium]
MPILIVTNSPEDWTTPIEGVQIVDARSYLTSPEFSDMRGAKVFNLCRSYKYQSIGYYVSLLAEARGHRPMPNVNTLQDLKTRAVVRLATEELDNLLQKSLHSIHGDKFVLSIYFGRNLARKYDRLALHLFNQFPAPFLRAHFAHTDGRWELRKVAAIGTNEVPDSHWPFVVETAREHFAGKRGSVKRKQPSRFDLAILHQPEAKDSPSNEKALQKFIKAAAALDIAAELITRDDYGRLAEFDALFIRDTTFVNQYTYRFSRRAAGEGLVVIDDPLSIARCTNKVYLAELLSRHKVATPRTIVAHKDNASTIAAELGLPCVLKVPDSAFSLGVVKVHTEEQLAQKLNEFFEDSDLVVAQEFLPTDFDWRIGIIDRQPLYACKYYMAQGHWQIVQRDDSGEKSYGKLETMPIEVAPRKAVQIALKAANLIGDGLYGVDVKESNGNFYVIEVNDNPNIDAGFEDAVLKDDLYRRIMQVFLTRIEQKKARSY